MTNRAQYAAMATLLDSMRTEVRQLRGLLRVTVSGRVCEMPLTHTWQPVPNVQGVEMCSLDPKDWPEDADPDADYHMTRGPGLGQSPGVMNVPQALRLEVITGHQRYWKESVPHFVDYFPGDVFICGPGEGHQWQTLEPFCNLLSFTPALRERRRREEPNGCSVTPDLK